MKNNNLNTYLEKKYGKDSKNILNRYSIQKSRYVEQVKNK